MKCLIIGYGSIGRRHAEILARLELDVQVVSKRHIADFSCHSSIQGAFGENVYDYIIVANKTSEHYQTVTELANLEYSGVLLVEKPVFDKVYEYTCFNFKEFFVAYNLRFHPILERIKKIVQQKKVLSCQVYAGSYLPDWRPGVDYSIVYSAKKAEGGGVTRDLSHELDYLLWLIGGWKRVTAINGTFSSLNIDSEDLCSLILETENCPSVTIQLNYFDRVGRRELIINLDNMTIKADLVKGILEINEERISFNVDRNLTYELMHQSIIKGDNENLCSFEEGGEVVRLIDAVEKAAAKKMWVVRQ